MYLEGETKKEKLRSSYVCIAKIITCPFLGAGCTKWKYLTIEATEVLRSRKIKQSPFCLRVWHCICFWCESLWQPHHSLLYCTGMHPLSVRTPVNWNRRLPLLNATKTDKPVCVGNKDNGNKPLSGRRVRRQGVLKKVKCIVYVIADIVAIT